MKIHFRFTAMFLLAFVAVVLALQSLQTTYAAGNWFVAPGGNDNNDCLTSTTPCSSINGALNKSGFVSGDTIKVAVGTYTGSGDEVVLLDKNTTLSGGWNITFTAQNGMSTIDGEASRRGITVNFEVVAVIEWLTIQNGVIGAGSPSSKGGGIYNSGTLTVDNSTVSNNITTGNTSWGGGIYNDDNSTLTVNNSFIGDNIAQFGQGGGVYNTATGNVVLNESAISSNMSDKDGGGILNSGIMIIEKSTVSDNKTPGYGGGIFNTGTITLNNSTISGNEATTTSGAGGGVYNTYIIFVNSSTISNNQAGWHSGGIYNYDFGGSSTLQNAILAGNTAPLIGFGPNCTGTISSSGYNLIGDTLDCIFTLTIGDQTNADPKLSQLVGSPGYHPLLFSSPAIDAGNPAGCTDQDNNPLTTDQRGVERVGRCDIGAFEYDGDIYYTFIPVSFNDYCKPLYADDFSNSSSGWPVSDDGNLRYEYLNGEYRILVRNPNSWAAARASVQVSDYIVSADVKPIPNLSGSYGLIFGISNDWTQFYTFEIDAYGSYGIWKYSSGSWTTLAYSTSGTINQGAFNQLKIERSGAQIKAHLNGQLLISLSDSSYIGSRRVGLIVSAYDQPNVDGRFDNFTICGGSSAASSTMNLLKSEEITLPLHWASELSNKGN